MKKLRILLLSLTVLSAVSCSKDEAVEQKAPDSFKFTLNATLPDVVDTRVAAEAVARLTWTAGDKLSVINLTTGKALGGDLTADVSGNKSTFSGTLTGTVNSGDKLAFLYPSQGYTAETTFSSATLDFSTQNGTVNDKLAVYATYTATSSSISSADALFRYLMSYMKITLTDLAASSAVKGATIGNINNALTLSISGGELVSAASGSGKTIAVTPSSAVTADESGVATLCVAVPESVTGTRTITVYDGTYYSKTSFTDAVLSSGKYYNTAVTGFDLTKSLVYIPDANFKSFLVTNYDTDSDGEISFAEALVPTTIMCYYEGIADLTGIAAFTNLESLICSNNQLTTLNLTANTALTWLECYSNELTTLDITANRALTNLSCSYNQITSLDVTANTALTSLNCGSNKLTTLNVSANTALTSLNCGNNKLTTLNVSANTALTDLTCSSNQITSLNLTANTALKTLTCSFNQITSLDVTANTALTYLGCDSNHITTLNLTANTALTSLNCSNNQLTTLNVSVNTALTNLTCFNNQLKTLDVAANRALVQLYCSHNQITSLDVTTNTALRYFYCSENQLTTLDITANTALEALYCHINRLATIDISSATALNYFLCSGQTTNGSTSQNIVIQANATQYPNWATICGDEDATVSCVQI